MAKIAFLLHNKEIAPWIAGEAKAFTFTEMFGNDKPADAYLVLADGEKDVEEFLPIVQGRLFAWFGDGVEQAKNLHPFYTEGNWATIEADIDILMTTANDMHEKIEADRRKEKETEKPHRPNLLRKRSGTEDEPEESTTFGDEAEGEEPQVIAVGGHGGASFVAWNLAAVTRLPLIEGRQTGSLSKWTGDQTSVEQALEETLPYGTVADNIPPKTVLRKRVIVDCGPDPRHPVFEHAKVRIWVTTLDPSQPPVPERVKVVVNRVPGYVPFHPREVVKADIALQVPDGGREALLTLFTHIPWILKQDSEMQAQWKSLVNVQVNTQKGATDTWDHTGW